MRSKSWDHHNCESERKGGTIQKDQEELGHKVGEKEIECALPEATSRKYFKK